MDEPLNPPAIQSAKGAEIIFSVTKEILEKYKTLAVPKYCINHGLSSEFILANANHKQDEDACRVGISGNLLRPDIDRQILLDIIMQNPAILFECWGPFQPKQSNIGGVEDDEVRNFIFSLQQMPNLTLHGAVPTSALAKEFQRMDAFLICYDVSKDQSKGTNYHKVIEYISTGKVIISNNITTYQDLQDLVVMVQARDDNRELPKLFKEVMQNLASYNREQLSEKRKAFALNNTYEKQVERIGGYLESFLLKAENTLTRRSID